jgi:predicted permease
MSRLLGLWHILRSSLNRRAADADTQAELADHVARQAEKHVADGMPPDEARRLATLELGGAGRWREATADTRRGRLLEDILTDTRYAVRGLVARPGFALSAFATLAIGIGAGATIMSLADGALLRPLPFPNADRVMSVALRMPIPEAGRVMDMVWSYPKYEMFRDRQQVFADLALRSDETLTLLFESGAERVPGETVGAAYFDILGVRPPLGRTFTPDEDRIGGDNAVVVVSDAFWRVRLGSRADALGQSVTIAGVRHVVIGVMPPGFAGLSGDAQLWIPIPSARGADGLRQPGAHNLELVGLLADGVSPAQARAATEALGRSIDEAYPAGTDWGATAYTFESLRMNPTIRRSLQLLAVAAGLLVLIVCSNLTTLLVTRGAGRRLELAIRLALGGSRARLSRQLVTESVVLAGLGGLGGLVIALVATSSLAAMLPVSMPTTSVGTDLTRLTFSAIHLDGRGIGLAVLLTLVIGTGAGLLSASRVAGAGAGAGAAGTLRQGASSATFGATRGMSSRTLLVIMQVALGLVFLVASGVTLESFQRILQVPLGWRPDGMLAVRLTLDPIRVQSAGAGPLWTDVTTGIRALPGVRHVALGSCSPLGDHCDGTTITPVGLAPGHVMYVTASPGYFDAVGTRLLRGRDFLPSDTGANRAMIVSETTARMLWGSADPLATPVQSNASAGGVIPVIGVVEDARYGDVEQPAGPAIFMPFTGGRGVAFVRVDGQPSTSRRPDRQGHPRRRTRARQRQRAGHDAAAARCDGAEPAGRPGLRGVRDWCTAPGSGRGIRHARARGRPALP